MESHKKSTSENTLPIRIEEPTSQGGGRIADISGKEVLYFIANTDVFMVLFRNSSKKKIDTVFLCFHLGK